jgi:hypothetical protein
MTTFVSPDSAITLDRLQAIKLRQQATWSSGDYAVIGATLQIVGEALNEAADVRAIHQVLDVAARQRQRHACSRTALCQCHIH